MISYGHPSSRASRSDLRRSLLRLAPLGAALILACGPPEAGEPEELALPATAAGRTFFVDGQNGDDSTGDGSTAKPWKTLNRAHARIGAGDTVRIRTAVYRERLAIAKAGTSWIAEAGHRPVLDGGYHEGLFGLGPLPADQLPPPNAYLPGNAYAAMIAVGAENVTVQGLTVRNVAGTGISTSKSGVRIRGCTIDFVYGGCLIVNSSAAKPANILVEDNRLYRCSVKRYDPTRDAPGPAGVQTCLQVSNALRVTVRRNEVAYCHGEGINSGKGSEDVIIEENVVHTNLHVHIYVCRGQRAIIRRNLVYHSGLEEFAAGKNPGGIVIGDERASNYTTWSNRSQIYDNIVVGMGQNFHVRNNDKATAGYDTQLDHTYVGFNTFVNATVRAIQIDGNQRGRPHRNSIFENNLILQDAGEVGMAAGVNGVVFRNNLWSRLPPVALRGTGDQLGSPRLTRPGAALLDGHGTVPAIDPRNYQLTALSALAIDRASDGGRVNDLQPPAVTVDFFGRARPRGARNDIGAHERQ